MTPFALTIHDQIRLIASLTRGYRTVTFQSILQRLHGRVDGQPAAGRQEDHVAEVIVTLLAVLELLKRRCITASQDCLFGEILITPLPGVEIPVEAEQDAVGCGSDGLWLWPPRKQQARISARPSQPYTAWTRARQQRRGRRPCPESASRARIAAAKAACSPGGTSTAQLASMAGSSPTAVATIGRPAAINSSTLALLRGRLGSVLAQGTMARSCREKFR